MKDFFINHICTAPPGAPEFCAERYDILVPVVVSALVVGAMTTVAFIISRRMGLL